MLDHHGHRSKFKNFNNREQLRKLRNYSKVAQVLFEENDPFFAVSSLWNIAVYTNSLTLISKLEDLNLSYSPIIKPKNDTIKNYLLNNPGVTITSTQYKFRITFNALKNLENFKKWSEQYPKEEFFVNIRTAYVQTESMIELCKLHVGKITRIEKLINENEIT